jgi:uncharacterized membrane protein YecN with MAPEG domain
LHALLAAPAPAQAIVSRIDPSAPGNQLPDAHKRFPPDPDASMIGPWRASLAVLGGTNMMMEYRWTALVTILALLVYFAMSFQVARARGKSGIEAPAMTGDPMLERANRVHVNMLEWLPLFLVGLWLFAIYWNALVADGLGIVWIVGRLVYSAGYMADPAKRSMGFLIQGLAATALLLGALGRIVYSLAAGGA